MTDALKPVWAEAVLFPGGAQKILALADEEAAAHFRGASWMSAALVHLGIEVRLSCCPMTCGRRSDERRSASSGGPPILPVD